MPSNERIRAAIASDHAGFALKEYLKRELSKECELLDLGAFDETPSDYPDFAEKVARAVVEKQTDRGIIVCGSGIGAGIAANKVKGIRAGLAHDYYSAHQGVEHDDMNVLCLGARVIGPAPAVEIVRAFMNARFSNEERHLRRLKKVLEIEKNQK